MWLHSLELSGENTPDSHISLFFASSNHTADRVQNTEADSYVSWGTWHVTGRYSVDSCTIT